MSVLGAGQPLSLTALVQQLSLEDCDSQEFQALAVVLTEAPAIRGQNPYLAGESLTNAEVHDCQPLIANWSPGPLAALLIDPVEVVTGDFSVGVPVADILSPAGPFPELGIPQGRSCLWLTQNGASWSAEILLPRTTGGVQSCASRGAASPNAIPLEVHRLTIAGASNSDYPATGRWMWDSGRDVQYIGSRCNRGWCEIGPVGGFTPTPQPTEPDSLPGWFDEQPLWFPDANGDLQLSRLVGRIRPGSGLEEAEAIQRRGNDEFDLHIATMTFDRRSTSPTVQEAFDKYVEKFKLNAADPEHEIRLRRATNWPWFWKKELQARSVGSRWTTIEPQVAHRHSGSGTIRWAWAGQADEGMWFPCDYGCCKAIGLTGRD